MINFNDLIKNNKVEEYELPFHIHYQIEAIKDSNKIIIRKLLNYENNPKNIIYHTEYFEHKCDIYPVCMKNINEELIVLELSIEKEKKYYIQLIFEPEPEQNIIINKEIEGCFKIYFKKVDEKKILHTYDIYPGNTEMIYNLFKFLIDNQVIDYII